MYAGPRAANGDGAFRGVLVRRFAYRTEKEPVEVTGATAYVVVPDKLARGSVASVMLDLQTPSGRVNMRTESASLSEPRVGLPELEDAAATINRARGEGRATVHVELPSRTSFKLMVATTIFFALVGMALGIAGPGRRKTKAG